MPTKTCAFCDGPLYINAPHHCPLAQPTPPPAPAPVDVEAKTEALRVLVAVHGNPNVQRELDWLLHLAARSAPVDADELMAVIEEKDMRIAELQRDLDAELEAQDRDIDHAALLAQCREALEAAAETMRILDSRGGLGFDVHDWLRATLETVRAALLAIKEGTA